MICFVLMLNKRIFQSLDPDPVATMLCWWWDQLIAFTAALCVFYIIGISVLGEYT